MTILYNQNTKQLSQVYPNGYNLPIRETFMHELEVVDIVPTLKENQWLTSEWKVDLENKQYVKVYTVHTKTAHQIAMQDWHEPDYAKRIRAPKSLALSYPEMYVWFQINDMPIHKEGYEALLYCNEILEEHQPLVDDIASVTVENRPNPDDYV